MNRFRGFYPCELIELRFRVVLSRPVERFRAAYAFCFDSSCVVFYLADRFRVLFFIPVNRFRCPHLM